MTLTLVSRTRTPRAGRLPKVVALLLLSGPLFLLVSAVGNRLSRHPGWESTKAGLGIAVMGSEAFVSGSQALARGRLDLSAWHGYQEVVTSGHGVLRSVELEFRLDEDAYLVVRLGEQDEVNRGLRLSRHDLFSTATLTIEPDGSFSQVEPIVSPPIDDSWHRLELDLENGLVRLDDARLETVDLRSSRSATRLALRGGQRAALVDDVQVIGATRRFRDRFQLPDDWLLRLGLVLGAGGLLLLALGGAVARTATDASTPFAGAVLITIAGLAGGMLMVLYGAYEFRLAGRYPNEDARTRDEEAFIQERVEARSSIIAEHLASGTDGPSRRILILGTSQTAGSGADSEEDTFVARLGAELNAHENGVGGECGYEVINGGVRAADSRRVATAYEDWLVLDPDLTIVHLSHNDSDAGDFGESLRRIRDLNDARGIQTLFSLEPNSVENRPGELPMHPAMREAARHTGTPIVDVHEALKADQDAGFLWWDRVHPTSFGHSLIARVLAGAVLDLGLICPSTSSAR